ncbi:entry exclusion lipoprotein TrbK [Escherichia coli]|nr:entry exclusion lipoprotein TrbK [Escherichia coli]ELM8940445.1 entry exclusion lipoprotein TrbK [Escherichia coli]
MKRHYFIGVALVVVATLSGCDNRPEKIEPSAKTCSKEYWSKLPAGPTRDTLVEKCMTLGKYRQATPQTF